VREFATSEDNADKRCHYSSDDVSRRLVHTATTGLSCRCRVRLGGVNWIPTDNSRLSPTENNLKSERVESNRPTHTRHDTDRTVLSCLARRCELDIIETASIVKLSVVRLSVCLSLPSFGRHSPLRRVCCCGPGNQEISIAGMQGRVQ